MTTLILYVTGFIHIALGWYFDDPSLTFMILANIWIVGGILSQKIG